MLNVHEMEQAIQTQMTTARVPGLALAIVQDQEIVYARGFGVTAADATGVSVTPQTLFRLASVTKPLTGTAVIRLVEAGTLDLDRPIPSYLPWFRLHEEGAAERVTLRMLLSHTAGLPSDSVFHGRRDPAGLEAHVREEIPRYPLVAPPGKVFSYSNLGINVAGYVAEVVAGLPFATLIQELVFAPLEMQRSTFDPLVALTYPVAQGHERQEDGTLRVQHRFAETTGYYPCGCALSTACDLANFVIMHLNEGRFRDRQVLSPATVAAMQTVHARHYTRWGRDHGLTWYVGTFTGGHRWVAHDGGMPGFAARCWLFPDAQLGIILLANPAMEDSGPALLIARTVAERLLDLSAPVPGTDIVEPDRSGWPRHVGVYLSHVAGMVTITLVDGQLLLDWNGDTAPLAALDAQRYAAQPPGTSVGISVGFVPEEEGPTEYLLIDNCPFRRWEQDPSFVPDPAALIGYAGIYHATVATAVARLAPDVLTVRVEEEQLIVHSQASKAEVVCRPLDGTRFSSAWGLLEFVVPSGDSAPALTLTMQRTYTYRRMHVVHPEARA
jgi:CubicO group peptidase (beta-lactamase class C family)